MFGLSQLYQLKGRVGRSNKRAYAYYLTSKGLQEKARLTVSFFDRKSKEYGKLKAELRELEKEIKVTQLD